MKSFQFGQAYGRSIEAYGSTGATVVHLVQHTPVFIATIFLEPGGLLGMHPAATDQLFMVVAGSGRTTAGGESCQLSRDMAVL